MVNDGRWAADEFRTVDLGDKRLNKRLIRVAQRLADAPRSSIPAAMEGWDETQAAYRLFQNKKVTMEGILEPHADSTLRRVAKESTVLVLQDTTELDFTSKREKNRDAGPLNYEERVGFYLHPSMVVTPEGLHLGTVDTKFWARDVVNFGKNVDRKKRPFQEKESVRWRDGYRVSCGVAKACPSTAVVNVADRESDIYEYLVEAIEDPTENSHFVVRAAANRSLTEKDEAVSAWTYVKVRDRLEESTVLCGISIKVPKRGNRKAREAILEIRSGTVELKPPHRYDGRLPKLKVNVVWAKEKNSPSDEAEPIDWMLLTDLPISTSAEAQPILSYYAMRWQIEVFFRVFKTGCAVEELEFHSQATLAPCLMVNMIVAWRVLNLMMLGRKCPDLPCDILLTEAEWKAAWQIRKKKRPPKTPPCLGDMLEIIASLGGHLGRKCDGPPGPKSLWIGLQRVADFALAWNSFGPND